MPLCWRGTTASPPEDIEGVFESCRGTVKLPDRRPCSCGCSERTAVAGPGHAPALVDAASPIPGRLGVQARHGPDAVQVVPQRPRHPPRSPGGGRRTFGQSPRRTRPSPSTPDAHAVRIGPRVPAEHPLRVLPEQTVYDIGRLELSPVGCDHSSPSVVVSTHTTAYATDPVGLSVRLPPTYRDRTCSLPADARAVWL